MYTLSNIGRFRRLATVGVMAALLAGCASIRETSAKYTLLERDPSKGVVVGTVFERSVFVPYGAYFYLQSPDNERIIVASGGNTGRATIVNNLPKLPKGVGSTFALQLSPGKYQVTGWALDYGRLIKRSEAFSRPIEFEVAAGQVKYLGRFDANRFLELASIEDNYAEDLPLLTKHPVRPAEIVNGSLNAKGWWLPNPAGRDIVDRAVGKGLKCEQC
ncbi:hypothetical protein LJR290_007986 [Variovorax sp. LjRoot290]|uniref:hypothetical protein n=1 Tax=Variovorax sp. LjRoot290 TaxID=3342316 RepID=UPI003ECDB65A